MCLGWFSRGGRYGSVGRSARFPKTGRGGGRRHHSRRCRCAARRPHRGEEREVHVPQRGRGRVPRRGGRAPHSCRQPRSRRERSRRHLLHRPAALRRLGSDGEDVPPGTARRRYAAAGLSVAAHAAGGVSRRDWRDRRGLWQAIRARVREIGERRAGPGAARARRGQVSARSGAGALLLQPPAGQHHRRFFSGSHLRRQWRQGRLEAGRLPRRRRGVHAARRKVRRALRRAADFDRRHHGKPRRARRDRPSEARAAGEKGLTMATKLKPVDVVIVGVGLSGTILAKELAEAGLQVVGLERGRWRNTDPDFGMPHAHDELRYVKRHELMQDLSRETISFRNNANETALPMRQLGSFPPGEGVGGGAGHWGGLTWRFLPWDFETRSRTLARYGKEQLAADCTSQDWGVSYAELEPHFDRFEHLYGISGKAGNLKGKIIPGGNPFEGPRSREYPTPPLRTSYAGSLFDKAAKSMGYKPFPTPSAALSRPYTNEYGATINACVYCGYCQFFGCEMGAKASPQTAVLPNLMKQKKFELRTLSNVIRVNLDSAKKRAVSVTYVDSRGREFEQPAEMVLLTSYVFNNVRLMLASGIGKAYDPVANTGVVGRDYAYQTPSSRTVFFRDKIFNQFMAAGGMGVTIDEFNGDNFDHSGLGFIGGGFFQAATSGSRPI